MEEKGGRRWKGKRGGGGAGAPDGGAPDGSEGRGKRGKKMEEKRRSSRAAGEKGEEQSTVSCKTYGQPEIHHCGQSRARVGGSVGRRRARTPEWRAAVGPARSVASRLGYH